MSEQTKPECGHESPMPSCGACYVFPWERHWDWKAIIPNTSAGETPAPQEPTKIYSEDEHKTILDNASRDCDNEVARLLDENARLRAALEGGEQWWAVYCDGKPSAAYPRRVLAEVYASGFSESARIEIRELSARAALKGDAE